MNREYEKLLGARIRDLREKANITQDTLSAKLQLRGCDITRSALAKIEVGQRHIYADELRLFKEILGANYTDILDSVEIPPVK